MGVMPLSGSRWLGKTKSGLQWFEFDLVRLLSNKKEEDLMLSLAMQWLKILLMGLDGLGNLKQ